MNMLKESKKVHQSGLNPQNNQQYNINHVHYH